MFRQHWSTIGLVCIVLAALFVRVVHLPDLLRHPRSASLNFKSLTNPVADWHSWRQADTASVTRELLKGEGSWLVPEFHDLSNIPSGLENPEGYRMVEFPLYNLISAGITKALPGSDTLTNLLVASRLVSVLFSLITLIILYALVVHLSENKVAALLTASFYAFLPYSIFYSRVILPEPTLVMLTTVSIYAFVRWLNIFDLKSRTWPWYLLSLVTFTLALLVKPTALFVTPIFVVLAVAIFKWRVFKQPLLWLFLVSLLPLAAWRWWILHYPSGIPASAWLLNGNGIRLRPAWWRWLFADRLARLMLGYWSVVFVALGSIIKSSKKYLYFDLLTLSWAAGMVLYLIIFATGNVQHDYYQIILVPMLCLLAGRGAAWILQSTKVFYPVLNYAVVALICGLTLLFGWYEAGGYFNINNPAIAEAGQAVDELTPVNAIVIAPYQGDTAFLYQTNRRGWPIGFEIQDKIKKGATHYITTSYDDEARTLEATYQTVKKTDQYLLLDLSRPIASDSAATQTTNR
jgi:hypothetical protein